MKHVFGKVSKRKLITLDEEKAIVLELKTQDLDIDEIAKKFKVRYVQIIEIFNHLDDEEEEITSCRWCYGDIDEGKEYCSEKCVKLDINER